MGRSAKLGEDRAITHLVLQEGYHVTFQSNAIVYTNVPVQYDKRCKMDLRWARSDLRKWVVMGAFMFKDFRPTPHSLDESTCRIGNLGRSRSAKDPAGPGPQ